MNLRTGIIIVSLASLLIATFLRITEGGTAVPIAMAFLMTGVLGIAVANVLQQQEARLKALEARLPK